MNSIKKIAIVGGALFASSALLVSFTNDNRGDKKKKYQIIHQSNGEVVTYDTILPMSSSFTPEQFVADKGISSEHVEVINIPSLSELDLEGTMMRTFVHELEIEHDGEESSEDVKINIEIDENGDVISKKTVNGVEVEMTKDEINEIKRHDGDHKQMIQLKLDELEIGESDEHIAISVNIDDEGNKTIKKVVNGEEIEISEEEMNNIHMFEITDKDDLNVLINSDELEGSLKELGIELEIEKLLEEGGDDVKIITKRIDLNSDQIGEDIDWTSEDGEQRIMISTSVDGSEDHTIVLVTEDYDESSSENTKMKVIQSSEDMDVFPNPNDGTFKIRYENDNKEKTSITVTDAAGRKVFEDKLGKFSGKYEKELNLKEFGSGMYTVTIQNGNNEEVQKVMIK